MDADLLRRIEEHPLWYHTIDLGDTVTPGWFDLRPIVAGMPWPDVAGKRCLDIGTWDGFLAFELERRGASEVVATDIGGHQDWDHLPRQRAEAIAFYEQNAGLKGRGFELAHEALGSKVHREIINIYDLSPERLGMFDVVVLGTLLLHLRSPFHALEAVMSVCRERFLSSEQIDPQLSLVSPRRPALYLEGDSGRWMIANAKGHRRMLEIAGFDILEESGPYVVPFGPNHPERRLSVRERARILLRSGLARSTTGDGVLHSAALTRPGL